MTILLVSDLHLCAARPATTAAFLTFLEQVARSAAGLYILGDLFDLWIGDDAIPPAYQAVLAALRTLAASGVAVGVMPGNHDFLYGAGFAVASGWRLLADPCVIDLLGTPTLLMHGDLLCTNDRAYQQLRVIVRDPTWQAAQLAQPAAARLALARDLQTRSRLYTAAQNEVTMDVNQAAVESRLRAAGVARLIHGHTHRPGYHYFFLNGAAAQRIVLPDWNVTEQNPRGGYLMCAENGCQLFYLRRDGAYEAIRS